MANIYVITGPSGAGKTSVAERLLARRPNLKRVVTCTTRAPRDGEIDGTHYRFLSLDAFTRLRDAGEMFEWAEVYPGRFYGSRRSDVDALVASGHDALFVVDVKGARTIKREHPGIVAIFVDAESTEELLERMASRDGGATADRAARIAAVEEERAFADECDQVVVNRRGELDAAVASIAALMDRP